MGFRYAFRGIALLARTQHNAWIHLIATFAVLGAGWACRLAPLEWCAIVLAAGGVWSAEALNTAIEFLANEVTTEIRPRIGYAKDLGAAGVLLSSIAAAIVGLIVFGPHLLASLRG